MRLVAVGDNGRRGSSGEAISGGNRLAVKALQDGRGGVPGGVSTLHQSARHVHTFTFTFARSIDDDSTLRR